ncbi:hypothetical protein KKF91_03220 [Myxococcota bacterium]|nr:hypothetical protein [Myxococcota bacterium]
MRVDLILCLMALSGCSLTQMTGDMMKTYTVEHMTPYMMTSDDLEMACETGISMGQVLMSFSRVVSAPHIAAVGVYATAATCSDEAAWREELRQLRALRAGNAPEAMDARIAEKRAHAVSARRYYASYQHLIKGLREPGDRCPEFINEHEETAWMLGLLSGLQATLHDRAASGAVGVPLDLPKKIARGSQCLNDEKWWGVPAALRAAVWVSVPGAVPQGQDPWATLAKARAQGEQAKVRLASAIAAQVAASAGKRALLVEIIKSFKVATKPAPQWRLIDALAARQVEAISDRLWTEERGHRTPFGELGSVPEKEEEDGQDGLLDGIEEDPAPATPTSAPAPDSKEAEEAL